MLCVGLVTPLSSALSQAKYQEKYEVEPYAFRAETVRDIGNKFEIEPLDYRGEPITAGSFLITPNLDFEQEYTQNVLAVSDNEESDLISVVTPSIEVNKNFGRHLFVLNAESEVRRHWDRTDDNVENHIIALNGNLEAKKTLNIPINISYRDAHVPRISQKRASAGQIVETPLNVKILEAESGIEYKPNRFALKLLGKYEQIRLTNEELISGGTLIRDNRDVDVTNVSAEISYDLRNGFTPFVRTTYADDNYVNEPSGTISRSNNALQVLSGANFNYKGLFKGFFGIGLQNRSYDDVRVDDTTDFTLDANLVWEPLAKTRFMFDAGRETYEDNFLTTALTETNFEVNWDQELQHDLFGRLGLRYEHVDFNDLDRTDVRLDASAEILKIINPRLQIGGAYYYTTRDSSIPNLDLKNNAFVLRLKTAL